MNFSEIKISVNWFCMVFSEKQIESYNGMAQSVERWTAGTVGTVGYRYIPGCCQEFFLYVQVLNKYLV